MKREHAYKLRELLHKAAVSLSDEDALDGVELFPAWGVGVDYARTVRVRYDGKLYRCEQPHTSQDGWEPPNVPALWTEVAKPGEIPVWKQPTGAQDAYRIGDKVHYPDENGPVYVSVIDNNVWVPTTGPGIWAREEGEQT